MEQNGIGFDEELRRNFKRNFVAGSMDFGLYLTAMSFSSSITILPAFLTYFTSSNVLIGLISSVTVVGWMMPQIIVANYTEGLSLKKRFVLAMGLGERFPWLILAIATLFLYKYPTLMLICFFLLLGSGTICGGIGTPAWLDMLAKAIPEKWRGRFFGFSRFAGTCLGGAAAFISGYLLDRYAFPLGFATCFLLTFIVMMISWFSLSFLKEPRYAGARDSISFKDYLSGLPSILRGDKNFSRYLLASIFISFTGMATSFFTVHAATSLNLGGGEIGTFTALFLISQTLINLVWGYVGDRKGHKLIIQISILCNVSAAILAAFSASVYDFYLVFVMAGIAMSASMVAGMNIILEFSSPERRPTYIGLSNILRTPSIMFAPILGGMLADIFGYPQVYMLTVIILLIGFAILLSAQDPRRNKAVVE